MGIVLATRMIRKGCAAPQLEYAVAVAVHCSSVYPGAVWGAGYRSQQSEARSRTVQSGRGRWAGQPQDHALPQA